mmetsp:Transcript_5990/g.21118  ORF Transcript_5990/g.21118 Transcript_5990/m.21118 type:complete len:251 (+) Transcript_5990:2305-3057(+)
MGNVEGVNLHHFTRREPKSELLRCTFHAITPVNHVPSNVHRHVRTHGTWSRSRRVRVADHLPRHADDVHPLPAHGHHRAVSRQEFAQARKERFFLQVCVVCFGHFLGWNDHFDGDELEASSFPSLDDVANQLPGHTVGFDHDERPFEDGSRNTCVRHSTCLGSFGFLRRLKQRQRRADPSDRGTFLGPRPSASCGCGCSGCSCAQFPASRISAVSHASEQSMPSIWTRHVRRHRGWLCVGCARDRCGRWR